MRARQIPGVIVMFVILYAISIHMVAGVVQTPCGRVTNLARLHRAESHVARGWAGPVTARYYEKTAEAYCALER